MNQPNHLFYQERADYEDQLALAQLIQKLNQTGHNPATSGNYSLRSHANPEVIYISQSGVDKAMFRPDHFIPVNKDSGEKTGNDTHSNRKLSDEAPLHLTVYRHTKAECVLHSHFLNSLLFAEMYPNQDFIQISGLELLKGLAGIKTHEVTVNIPCFENTQDMEELSIRVAKVLQSKDCKAIILRGHGIYVWGDSLKEAKRHLEVFEYVFQYFLAMKGLRHD